MTEYYEKLCKCFLEDFFKLFKCYLINLFIKIKLSDRNYKVLKRIKKNLFKICQKWAIILRRFILWGKAERSENALKKGLNEFKLK